LHYCYIMLWRSIVTRLETFTAIKIHVEVLLVMTSSSAVGYQRFGGPCCLQLYHTNVSEYLATSVVRVKMRGSKDLQNVGILPHHYMALQSRGRWLESSLPWKHQISHKGSEVDSSESDKNCLSYHVIMCPLYIQFSRCLSYSF